MSCELTATNTCNVAPTQRNIAARQGDEFSAIVTLTDGGSPVSLSGYTVSAAITSLVDGREVDTFALSVVSSTAGRVSISLQETDTAALASGSYAWSLRWTAPGDVRRTAVAGIMDVTR